MIGGAGIAASAKAQKTAKKRRRVLSPDEQLAEAVAKDLKQKEWVAHRDLNNLLSKNADVPQVRPRAAERERLRKAALRKSNLVVPDGIAADSAYVRKPKDHIQSKIEHVIRGDECDDEHAPEGEMEWGATKYFVRIPTRLKIDHPHPAVASMKYRTFSEYDSMVERLSVVLAVLATVCCVLTVLILQVQWDDLASPAVYTPSDLGQALKVINSLLTLITMFVLYKYYRLQMDLDSIRFDLYTRKRIPFWSSHRKWLFLVEILVAFVHTPPFMDFSTTFLGHHFDRFIEDKMNIFIFIRLYQWLRVVRDRSAVYKWRKWVLQSGRLHSGHPHFDAFYVVKTHFYASPWIFTISLVFAAIVHFAFFVYICERDNDPVLWTYKNSVYFMCVTMTTVGYGDMSPASGYGRMFALSAALVGVCLAALLVTALMNSLQLSPNQRISVDLVNMRHSYTEQRKMSVKVLIIVFRRARIKRKMRQNKAKGLPTSDLEYDLSVNGRKLAQALVDHRLFRNERLQRDTDGTAGEAEDVGTLELKERLASLEASMHSLLTQNKLQMQLLLDGGRGMQSVTQLAGVPSVAPGEALTVPHILSASEVFRGSGGDIEGGTTGGADYDDNQVVNVVVDQTGVDTEHFEAVQAHERLAKRAREQLYTNSDGSTPLSAQRAGARPTSNPFDTHALPTITPSGVASPFGVVQQASAAEPAMIPNRASPQPQQQQQQPTSTNNWTQQQQTSLDSGNNSYYLKKNGTQKPALVVSQPISSTPVKKQA